MPKGREAIAATTGAAQVVLGTIRRGDRLPVYAPGLQGSEVVDIEVPDGLGGWVPLIIGGSAVRLSQYDTKVTLDEPGTYRVNKSITASAVPVIIDNR